MSVYFQNLAFLFYIYNSQILPLFLLYFILLLSLPIRHRWFALLTIPRESDPASMVLLSLT